MRAFVAVDKSEEFEMARWPDPSAMALMDLLCKAAGLEDHKNIRAIECRVSIKEAVQFSVELLGRDDEIGEALKPHAKDA
jgi:hypothetical protein